MAVGCGMPGTAVSLRATSRSVTGVGIVAARDELDRKQHRGHGALGEQEHTSALRVDRDGFAILGPAFIAHAQDPGRIDHGAVFEALACEQRLLQHVERDRGADRQVVAHVCDQQVRDAIELECRQVFPVEMDRASHA